MIQPTVCSHEEQKKLSFLTFCCIQTRIKHKSEHAVTKTKSGFETIASHAREGKNVDQPNQVRQDGGFLLCQQVESTKHRKRERERRILGDIQCVSLDSTSFIIYPEIKATEVSFSALKRYLCSFYFRIDNETGGIHRNTLYIPRFRVSHC